MIKLGETKLYIGGVILKMKSFIVFVISFFILSSAALACGVPFDFRQGSTDVVSGGSYSIGNEHVVMELHEINHNLEHITWIFLGVFILFCIFVILKLIEVILLFKNKKS
jgi:preprotein translocase subunit SecG